MARPDFSPNQRGTPEQVERSAAMKVYPLGFTPGVKQYLEEKGLDLANQESKSDLEILGFLTEEEIAVTLAKISRNPGGFLEIARTVSEEGASQFHQKWVVSIEGYGHASVAEHAMIHMAFENISSLAGDVVADNRLASFTEFSARFKGRQDVGYFTPEGIRVRPYLSEKWHHVHSLLFNLNEILMAKGISYVQSDEGRLKQPDRRFAGAKGVKTVADQFKNLMPASRLTSIGVTMNAREVEHAIRKMLSSSYLEVQEVGRRFKEESLKVAPTLVKYAEKNNYLVLTTRGVESFVSSETKRGTYPKIEENGGLVRLVGYDKEAENRFIAAALYRKSSGKTFEQLFEEASQMDESRRERIFEILLKELGSHDAPIRMLELAGDYVLEIPGMTYGDWREWKRHRMESYDAKDLSVEYGYMIPPLAYEMDESRDPQYHGCSASIKRVMYEVELLFQEVRGIDPLSAHYPVTRLHYRPAIVKMNVREAFHLISLRSGPTAHPFIRRLAWQFYDEIKKVHPLFAKYLGKKLYAEGRPSRDFVWTY